MNKEKQMTLFERMSKVQSTNPYFKKDLQKAKKNDKIQK